MSEERDYVSRTAEGLNHYNTLVLKTYWVRLFDPFHVPMPNAPYRVTLGERILEGTADGDAWLNLPYVREETRCLVEWGKFEPRQWDMTVETTPPDPSRLFPLEDSHYAALAEALVGDGRAADDTAQAQTAQEEPSEPEAPPSDYLYRLELYLDLNEAEADESLRRRLHNLGFHWHDALEENVRSFQHAFDWDLTGVMNDIAEKLSAWHDTCEPEIWPVTPRETPDAGEAAAPTGEEEAPDGPA